MMWEELRRAIAAPARPWDPKTLQAIRVALAAPPKLNPEMAEQLRKVLEAQTGRNKASDKK